MTEKFGIDLGPDYKKVISGDGESLTRDEKIAAFKVRREDPERRI